MSYKIIYTHPSRNYIRNRIFLNYNPSDTSYPISHLSLSNLNTSSPPLNSRVERKKIISAHWRRRRRFPVSSRLISDNQESRRSRFHRSAARALVVA